MLVLFVIAHIRPVSDGVVRVEGASSDGAYVVIDILSRLCDGLLEGNFLRVDIGSHSLAYAVNAHVVSVDKKNLLASYGGLMVRCDGCSLGEMPCVGSVMEMSVSCEFDVLVSKRARCAV